ncbi:MAG: PadR family transcriptional regulator [Clostridiales bacterium]|nr:PadR family transcriptional regulator [Clostridiales bacterium]
MLAADLIRGHTDALILSVLMQRDSYGYDINKAILAGSEGEYELKEATLYTAFKRLEEAGAVISYWGDENTGARRKYYQITEQGRALYQKLYEEWLHTKRIIDKLLYKETKV